MTTTPHWFGPTSASSVGGGHPVMFGKPQPAAHFEAMPDGGGYPKGFVEWALGLMGCEDADEVLHVCSGSMRTGVRVDVRPTMRPSVVADGRALPFKAGTFRYVLIDPPYAEDYAKNLYGTAARYPSPGALLREAARVMRPGGRVGLLHFLVPVIRRPLRIERVYGVTTGSGYAIRAWTLLRREADDAQLTLEGAA